MRLFLLATSFLSLSGTIPVQDWMEQAFYPVLFAILVVASLGLPVPEDVPLIAAGVLIKTYPGIATLPKTLVVALVGIMVGDLVLYMLGRRWGQDVLSHRSVRWLVSPQRYERARGHFHRHGMWFCFFGRFFMGIRAVMCLAAGATHFPYWRFFLADLGGALLSVPLFVYLGYWFAGMIPTLRHYITDVQMVLWTGLAIAVVVAYFYYKRRRLRRRRLAGAIDSPAQEESAKAGPPLDISARAACPDLIVPPKDVPVPEKLNR